MISPFIVFLYTYYTRYPILMVNAIYLCRNVKIKLLLKRESDFYLSLKKTVFYIVERPFYPVINNGEVMKLFKYALIAAWVVVLAAGGSVCEEAPAAKPDTWRRPERMAST